MLRPLPTLLSVCIVLVTSPPARANDSAMGGHGGSLVPLKETRVVMVSEDIELTYAAGHWDVRAHYVFRNGTHTPVALQMGFPETHCDGEGDCVMAEGDVFEDMRTFVRGQEVPRKKGKLSDQHAWAPKLGMVWLYDVTFAAGEQLEIDHRYRTPSGTDVMGSQFTTYVTRTGALWGKAIERATFRVRLPRAARQVQQNTGVPRLKVERTQGPAGGVMLTYEARNWRPTQDFNIGFSERVDWDGLAPAGPLSRLRCSGLSEAYMAAKSGLGEGELPASEALDLPSDAPSLRICRNAVYAQHGRRFKDGALNQYFYGPAGFRPVGPAVLAFDPNPRYSDALLTPLDRRVLGMIAARERSATVEQGASRPGPGPGRGPGPGPGPGAGGGAGPLAMDRGNVASGVNSDVGAGRKTGLAEAQSQSTGVSGRPQAAPSTPSKPHVSAAPGSNAPGSNAPGSDAPGSGAPGSDAPGSGAPGSDAPGSTAPGSTAGCGACAVGARGSARAGAMPGVRFAYGPVALLGLLRIRWRGSRRRPQARAGWRCCLRR